MCDTRFDVGTTFCALLRFFECDIQQYAGVPRNKITTEYKAIKMYFI